jgi:DNA-binding MurR/RpiR family transcriptional regulator
MGQFEKSVIPIIESVYSSFTPLEKNIADFFIHNTNRMDFSARNIAQLLYTSEASLSRFAQKCGFSGYREFIFHYMEAFTEVTQQPTDCTRHILNTYQELLNKSYTLTNEDQMNRISHILAEKSQVYVYGFGSSGHACHDIELRLMRIGVNIKAISDSHIMKMNAVLLNENSAVIGITVSGHTGEILQALRTAKQLGAATILMTAHNNKAYEEYCDEVLLVAVKENLENGKAISPQFPILVMFDILYSHYFEIDRGKKEALHNYTLQQLKD